jgi:hypothetical protein
MADYALKTRRHCCTHTLPSLASIGIGIAPLAVWATVRALFGLETIRLYHNCARAALPCPQGPIPRVPLPAVPPLILPACAPPPCRRFSGCSALRLRWRCFTAGGLSLPFLLASWPHRLVGSWEEDVMQRLRCCSSQRGLGGAIGIGFILLALAIGGLEGTVM